MNKKPWKPSYMHNNILEVKNLTKKFGNFTAVDDISFYLKEGEILGLLGPNGAGKTTTIHMLLGVTEPTEGNIYYFQRPFKNHREEILKQVNFSSGYISLPWLLSIEEILDVFARLYEVPDKKKRIKKLMTIFEIEDLLKKQFYQLSSGQKTRVLLVKAFINYPKIILLDEPTASLDPDIAKRVREFLKKERKEFNVSMLFTSHNMPEVEEMCDRVIFINRGKIIAQGIPADIAKQIRDTRVQLLVSKDTTKAVLLLKKKGLQIKQDNYYLTITVPEKNIASLLTTLAKQNIVYEEISIEKPDLEDFFLSMTTKQYA